LPFSTAVSLRVTHHLRRGQALDARRSAYTAIMCSLLVMSLLSGIVFYAYRGIGAIFIDDDGVLDRMKPLAFIAAVLTLLNSLQGCAQGILIGTGRHRDLMRYVCMSVSLYMYVY
jgi:Na+-driven multidrug efflux pump